MMMMLCVCVCVCVCGSTFGDACALLRRFLLFPDDDVVRLVSYRVCCGEILTCNRVKH